MNDWQALVAYYAETMSAGFRELGIEKTVDETRVIIEEELVNAQRQILREDLYTMIRKTGVGSDEE